MEQTAFYRDHYDVIVIGCSLAGMSAAMKLAAEGMSVLILERHNLPGGIATSFVRDGIEVEATLHEMMSIGPADQRLPIGEYLDDMGVKIDWLRVPEAYRLYVPEDGIDITLHAGTDADGVYTAAKEIESVYPGNEEKVDRLLKLCKEVMDTTNYLNDHTVGKLDMIRHHRGMTMTAGYSAKEVMDALQIPQTIQDVLSAYWIYVGQPISNLPFAIFAFLMGDYFTGGSYFIRNFSHGMSVAMSEKCADLGVQIEFRQEVEKILVKDRTAYGVRTKHGEEIHGTYIISGIYPDAVFGKMIEPASEVPPEAFRLVNGRKIGVSCFSVCVLLDRTAEELGIEDYSVFDADEHFDSDRFFAEGAEPGGWHYLTTICYTKAAPDSFPKGTCYLTITQLPLPESFENVTPDNYFETKRRIAREILEHTGKRLGVNLFDHILEIEVETPATIAHYSGQYRGGVYGYQHTMDDSVVARLPVYGKEHYIRNLTWASSAALAGNGMAVNINNGRIAAHVVCEWDKESREGR